MSEGCKRIATTKVTGPDIESVTFFVDGKRQATVKKAPFQTKIKTFKLSRGHHKVTAQVTFTQGSDENPSPAKFQGGFLRCGPAPPAQLHRLAALLSGGIAPRAGGGDSGAPRRWTVAAKRYDDVPSVV